MICTGVCALAAYINSVIVMRGFILEMVSLAASIFMTCKIMDLHASEATRNNYLYALSFFIGYLMGPGLHMIAEFDPSMLVQAVSYTAILFGSFTSVALFSKRRSYLFLGGVINTVIFCMMWNRLLSWVFGYSTVSMAHLMVGLFVASMYVVYDTQLIIERAEMGFKDVPSQTLTLFLDLVEMFIRVLRILMELQEKDRKKKKERD